MSTPMLVAKSCHDLDVILWNLESPCVRVSSMGSLRHFRAVEAPEGAPERCTDGCPAEDSCPYFAPFLYLGRPDASRPYGWSPVTPLSWIPLTDHGEFDPASGMLTETAEERLAQLRRGPYGRCVYRCHNDAVDHQLVSMELASGASVVLVVHGHSDDDQRTMRYDGTKATLYGRFGDFCEPELRVHHHRSGRVDHVTVGAAQGLHGGGDVGLLRAFGQSLRGQAAMRTDAREALESHLLGFAAEEARRSETVIDVGKYRAALGHA
jgi:predicted dehydrogenase